jgi:nitrate/nitrite-specific signal transduction histidine kinase
MPEQTLNNAELIVQIQQLEQDKEDLEILVETITEHSTDLENEIYEKNQTMTRYLEEVQKITAAAAVEKGTFSVSSLNEVANREDELGQLARVFQTMVQQVKMREEKLKQQVEELRIEIDRSKQAQQVAEIVATDSFKTLKAKLQKLKQNRPDSD